VSVVVPFQIVTTSSEWWAWAAASLLLIGHLALLPVWRRCTRRFLLSTEWARTQDFPGDVRLFKIRRIN
jgi:hypothetical protein